MIFTCVSARTVFAHNIRTTAASAAVRCCPPADSRASAGPSAGRLAGGVFKPCDAWEEFFAFVLPGCAQSIREGERSTDWQVGEGGECCAGKEVRGLRPDGDRCLAGATCPQLWMRGTIWIPARGRREVRTTLHLHIQASYSYLEVSERTLAQIDCKYIFRQALLLTLWRFFCLMLSSWHAFLWQNAVTGWLGVKEGGGIVYVYAQSTSS